MALLAVHATLLGYSAWCHSPTFDEPGHLAAGLSHWSWGNFQIFPVNPPLVRLVASFPIWLSGSETDWTHWNNWPANQLPLGRAWVHVNGERANSLICLARWACIPWSLLGACVCFRWAKELSGCRSPAQSAVGTGSAGGHQITSDCVGSFPAHVVGLEWIPGAGDCRSRDRIPQLKRAADRPERGTPRQQASIRRPAVVGLLRRDNIPTG